ncbi:MAG: hypothetical protein ACMX3H_15205 [Sodalis sp. (in: enterobacteria)]|uniref:hypothetical protein n=1 Tax=Sodalis sp. (in: enterobacteria) TaxID=1898979 RepID=UPI0039E36FA7
MKDIISPVETADSLFHDGDPSTGAEGTVVHAKWLNAMQGAMMDTQTEHKTILAEVGAKPDSSQSAQLLAAIKAIATNCAAEASAHILPVGTLTIGLIDSRPKSSKSSNSIFSNCLSCFR